MAPMHAEHTPTSEEKRERPRVLPPLPHWSSGADFLLREIPDPGVAAELWIQLRHLRDWLTSLTDSTGLFHAEPSERILERRAQALASLPDRLLDPIRTFYALTDRILLPDDKLAGACLGVADWALETGYVKTAMQFTAAAARVTPTDPNCLNAAGLAHRRGGESESALLYYQLAAYWAHFQRNADEHASAHIGLAAIWSSRGDNRRARQHLGSATNIAERSGSMWLGAHVQHDLMLMLTERREYSAAEAAAARAISLYPVNDPRLPFFAADFAFLQISQGYHADAVPALELFASLIRNPAQQVIGLSLLARAYAGTGRTVEFAELRDKVQGLVSSYPADAAAALFHLAEAARSLHDWAAAIEFAERSRQVALEQADQAVAQYAAELAVAINERQSLPRPWTRVRSGDRGTSVNTLSVRLRSWNAGSRRGRRRRPRRNHWA